MWGFAQPADPANFVTCSGAGIAAKMGGMSEVTEEVRQWLDEVWDPERPLLEWRQILADSGWGCPTWPKEWYGRGLSNSQAAEVARVFNEVGAVGPPTGPAMTLAAHTILPHGSDDLKRTLLRRIVTGED